MSGFLIAGCAIYVIACQSSNSHIRYFSKRSIDWSKTFKGELKNRAKEEEINYFFTTGFYDLSIRSLERHIKYIDDHVEDWDDYPDYPKGFKGGIYPEVLENRNIVDKKGNIVDIKPFLKLVDTEGHGPLLTKIESINVEEYKTIKELYNLRGTFYHKFYCKTTEPRVIPEDLIFDDNLVVRLYDKNNKILDEYKMRNQVNFEEYKSDPVSKQKRIHNWGGEARLIGMLKLPPKHKRKGLKYRVLKLDKQGKPLVYYRSPSKNKPQRYYLLEETLPPYSEYKYWDYGAGGCYTSIADPH